MNQSKKRRIYTVNLLGDSNVGKTAIRRSFEKKEINEDKIKSVGVDMGSHHFKKDGRELVVHIWDFKGTKESRDMQEIYFKGMMSAMLVFDLTSKDSLFNLISHVDFMIKHNTNPKAPVIMIGNKVDLDNEIAVEDSDIKEIRMKLSKKLDQNVPYMEVSAKERYHIEDAFVKLISLIDQTLDEEQR